VGVGGESLTEVVQAPFRCLSSVVHGQSSTVSNETIWVLKGVSFEACPELSRGVQRGEVVGIPSTGSGQALAATGRGRPPCSRFSSASPSRRRATPRLRRELSRTIHGRVASLLEVGIGFHPELTGRENIYLNGAIPSAGSGQAWG
jgi:lipopolysaccharide transport system ATP-binding protein